MDKIDFTKLEGEIFSQIKHCKKNSVLLFVSKYGAEYLMFHDNPSLEEGGGAFLVDITGNISDLIDTPIVVAERRVNSRSGFKLDWQEEAFQRWTFFELRTIKGSVTFRWYGEANEYYSIDADVYLRTPQETMLAYCDFMEGNENN